jgi:hypothetical protein
MALASKAPIRWEGRRHNGTKHDDRDIERGSRAMSFPVLLSTSCSSIGDAPSGTHGSLSRAVERKGLSESTRA